MGARIDRDKHGGKVWDRARAQKDRARLAACVLVETMLALILGLLFIGRHSLWLDEAVSVRLSQLPTSAFASLVTGREANSAAYFTLLRGWMSLGGDGEAWPRSLSTVAYAGTVPGLYLLGRLLFGRTTGIIAALLFALSPAGVVGAQEARGFALETCLIVFSAVFFLSAAERGGAGRWCGWITLSILASWVHLLALLVPFAFVLAFVVARGRGQSRYPLLGLPLIVLAAAPLAYAGYRGGQGGLGFLRDATLGNALRLPIFVAGGSLLLAAWLVVLGSVAMYTLAKSLSERTDRRAWFPVIFTLSWLVVPVLLALAVSTIKPLFSPRYFLFELPALVLLLSSGVRLLPPFARTATLAITILLSAFTVAEVYDRPPKADWRAATQYVLQQASASDGIIFDPTFERIPFQYYLDLLGDPALGPPLPIIPADPWGPLPLEDYALVQQAVDGPRRLFWPGQRVWVLGSGASRAPDVIGVRHYLAGNARLTLETKLSGLTVQRFELRK